MWVFYLQAIATTIAMLWISAALALVVLALVRMMRKDKSELP